MKNKFKRLLKKKGFTLAEIIVVLLVSSMLIAIAMGMLAPVRRLMNTLKANAHMDAACDTVNEYIRGTLQSATSVCIIPYSDLDTVKEQWGEYTKKYTKADGYMVKALGIMENYNGDFRLYDFGDVSVINHSWGDSLHLSSAGESDAGTKPGTAFSSLIKDRDGGGRWMGGLDGHEFHKFDVFNEAFYSNGRESGGNYGIQVAFEVQSKNITVKDEETGEDKTISGVNYLTVYSQIFSRIGDYSWDKSEGGVTYFKNVVEVEPANQIKSLSFKLLSGTATLDQSNNVNKVVEKFGTKEIELAEDPNASFTSDPTKHKMTQDGLVILYVVRDFDVILAP